jgi:exonuclease VII small subunit
VNKGPSTRAQPLAREASRRKARIEVAELELEEAYLAYNEATKAYDKAAAQVTRLRVALDKARES